MYTYQVDEDSNVILRSPSGEEKILYGEDKQYFLEDAEFLEETEHEAEQKVSDLIRNYYWN